VILTLANMHVSARPTHAAPMLIITTGQQAHIRIWICPSANLAAAGFKPSAAPFIKVRQRTREATDDRAFLTVLSLPAAPRANSEAIAPHVALCANVADDKSS